MRFRTRRPDTARRPLLGERLELVSTRDGRTHIVRDVDYGQALADRAGWCPAVCGHGVVMASLSTPPGKLCPACIATR